MTNRNNGIKERIVSGLAERGYTLKEMLSTSLGASGSVVFKGEYEGKPVALKLASYGLLNSFAGDNVEKLEDFRRREIETLRLAGNHPNILNYIESFSIVAANQDPIYALIMEYLDYPSIAARIKKGERVSDEEAKVLLKDGLSAEDHLHTGLPTQILHRDIKTPNVLFNGKKAYVIDFDIVKQGDRDSTRATEIEPNGYYPADFYRGTEEAQRPEHDVVALGNVAIAGISGKEIGLLRYEQGLYGLEPVDTGHLNVSPAIRKYLAKMIASPTERFQTAREAIEGLERILGTSRPVIIQPKQPAPAETQTGEVTKAGNSDLPEVEIISNRKLRIRGDEFDIGNSPYETLKNLISAKTAKSRAYQPILGQAVRAYANFAAQTHPILQEALDGKLFNDGIKRWSTLEGMLREKGPSFFTTPVEIFLPTESGVRGYSKFKERKTQHNQKRAELLKVFGADETDYIERAFFGGMIGVVLGTAGGIILNLPDKPEYIIPYLGLTIALGALALPYHLKQRYNRKLTSQAREIDSWLAQARNSQMKLEDRVEAARLTGEEEKRISRIPSFLGYSTSFSTFLGGMIYLANLLPKESGDVIVLAAGIPSALVGLGIYEVLNSYLTSRALKRKRQELGLPEPKMVEYTFNVNPNKDELKGILSEANLKSVWYNERKFVGDGVKVVYKPSLEPIIDARPITIRAESEEKAQSLLEALKPLRLPAERASDIALFTGAGPYVNVNEAIRKHLNETGKMNDSDDGINS